MISRTTETGTPAWVGSFFSLWDHSRVYGTESVYYIGGSDLGFLDRVPRGTWSNWAVHVQVFETLRQTNRSDLFVSCVTEGDWAELIRQVQCLEVLSVPLEFDHSQRYVLTLEEFGRSGGDTVCFADLRSRLDTLLASMFAGDYGVAVPLLGFGPFTRRSLEFWMQAPSASGGMLDLLGGNYVGILFIDNDDELFAKLTNEAVKVLAAALTQIEKELAAEPWFKEVFDFLWVSPSGRYLTQAEADAEGVSGLFPLRDLILR